MTISASTVAAHRFGTVRRRGYDPAEVDAAMERIAEAIAGYEQLTTRLREQLAEARDRDQPADAISRVLEVADRTKAELIAEGEAEAEDIRRRARSDVEDMVQTAWIEAKRIRSSAEGEVTTMVERLEATLQRTESEVEARLLTAEYAQAAGQIAAAQLEEESTGAAEQAVAEARGQAEDLVAAAERDRAEILLRTAALRTAYAEAEQQLRDLATATLHDLEALPVLDLTDPDQVAVELAPEEQINHRSEPGVVELAARRQAGFADPDGSGRPPVDRPVIDPEDLTATATYYQRRAGGLRARIEKHSAAQ